MKPTYEFHRFKRAAPIIASIGCFVTLCFVFSFRSTTAEPRNVVEGTPAASRPLTKGSWNPSAAAAYLDHRETSWAQWSDAARDHGTFCISCHTAVPYALARPVLRRVLAEPNPTNNELKIIESVTKRVRLWKDVRPVYEDNEYGSRKSVESRATEAVLNALVLSSYDAQTGKVGDDARTALSNMWALQQTSGSSKGSWLWQQFALEPWESSDSQYFGAALAAAAVGLAPQDYRATPEVQNHIKMLRDYLDREYTSQSTLNHIFLLWASTKLPDLISPERRSSIVQEALQKQGGDGGWNLFSLSRTWRDWGISALFGTWKRSDGTPQDTQSDGCATGLVVFALEEAGLPGDNVQLKNGLSWLGNNQDKTDGFWSAHSLNRRRNPSSMTGQFMNDAATAYAALALAEAK